MKYVMLVAFFAVMALVGVYCRNKANDVNNFLLGGRKMGPWMSAFAYGTSYFSAVIFIGYAGKFGYLYGLSITWIGIANALIGSLLAWLILAEKTRTMTHKLNAKTMPEFFQARYGSSSMKIFSAIIIFIFLIPYSASVYQGISYLFELTFGISYLWCMLAIAVLTAVYILLGGYIATSINDFIQGLIMIVGVLALVYCIVNNVAVGGLSEGIARLTAIDETLTSIGGPKPFDMIALLLLTSLGCWGLPQMVHKFYAIKDKKSIKQGTIISTIFALILAGGAYFIGSFGRLFFQYNNAAIPANLDEIMPQVLEWTLADKEWMMGLIVVLILSASMSTLASLVLTSSSTIAVDLVTGFIKPNMTKKGEMLCMRLSCLAFVILSVIVAFMKGPIATLMSYSWGGLAGAFIAPYIYGLWWKGVTKAGAWAGFIIGIGTTITGIFLVQAGITTPPAVGVAAMLLSLIIVPIVSLFTPKLSKAQLSKAFDD